MPAGFWQIKDRLIVGARIALRELVTETEEQARETLITFLSLLELAKLGFVRLAQNEPYSDLWILPQRPIEADALARVEEYDNLHSQDVALKLIEEVELPVDGEQYSLLETEDGGQAVFEGQLDGDALLKDIESLKTELAEETLTDEMASDDEIMAAEDQLTPEKDPEYEQ